MNLDNSRDYGICRTMDDPVTLENSLIEFVASKPNKYHLTIKYPYNTSKRKCREGLNQLIRYLNRDIYKGRYSKELSFIEGFACEEFSTKENTYHYHIVIIDCEHLPDYKRFNELIVKKISKIAVHDPKNQIKDPFLQNYFNHGENILEKYVTKDVFSDYRNGNSFGSTIGLLSASDVLF